MSDFFVSTSEIVAPNITPDSDKNPELRAIIDDEEKLRQALKWGVSNDKIELDETQLKAGVLGWEWQLYGNDVRGIATHDHGVIVRDTPLSTDALAVAEGLSAVYEDAQADKVKAALLAVKKSDLEERLYKEGLFTKIRGLGKAALGGVAGALPFMAPGLGLSPGLAISAGTVAAGWGAYDGVKGFVASHQLKEDYSQLEAEQGIEGLSEDAAGWFSALSPLLGEVRQELSPQEGDTVIQDGVYEASFRHIVARLKRPGGPDYDDYKLVVEGLKDKARGRKYMFHPASEVPGLLQNSKGALWEDGKRFVQIIAEAQAAIAIKRTNLAELVQAWKHNPGIDFDALKEQLNKDLTYLEHSIELAILDLYRVSAEQDKSWQTATAHPVQNPYVDVPPVIAPSQGTDRYLLYGQTDQTDGNFRNEE